MKYFRLTLYSTLIVVALGGWCDNKQTAGQDLVSAYNRFPSSRIVNHPEIRNNLPTDEIIRSEGYPAETHYATTPDGYILALHRIPYGKTNSDPANREVVFVQHGLLCSSADWIMSTPSKGLGYMLAEAGYDVWLGNYRGNTYSRNHTFFNPNEGSGGFWDFTWDEMAKFDIPTQIEKVLEITGKDELQYIGHSMGTTAFMAMHHYKQDVASKIRLAHLLSPVAYVGNMESPIGWIAGLGPLLDAILGFLGIGEFLPGNVLMDCLATLFCHEGLTQGICTNILFILCGFDEPQMNTTLLETIMKHTPAGASTPTVLHYAQEVTSDEFHGYDWGSDRENFNHHGANGIPNYSLTDVTTPVAVYFGQNDWLASSTDVLRTISELPNIVGGMQHMVKFPTWNHLDFLWGIDADTEVYADVLANMKTCWETDCRV
ncbi:lipase 3 [Eurytemora carolleeae]|uniref:lipase 3 n=1 Tax=Eurytemora carolleeae TaxID=1294199 RepID=UPI000C763F2E|nr:lipase 3 [Eurytemora carolleeae]|eukprot:XP_023341267.1 lipase 3-like [Eurytemora affinis]